MNELPPSDALSTLRRIAEADIACEQCTDINPRQLLALVEIAERSIDLAEKGFRNNGIDLIVRERKDKTDPHYKWCTALERWEALCKSK